MDVRKQWPNQFTENTWGSFEGSYNSILESFGYEILLQVDDDDYQGDSRVLFQDGERVGLLVFGWGSCSGCDALEACATYEDLQELWDSMYNNIHWEASKETMLAYISNKDWELDWSWSADETKQFVEQAKRPLAE